MLRSTERQHQDPRRRRAEGADWGEGQARVWQVAREVSAAPDGVRSPAAAGEAAEQSCE